MSNEYKGVTDKPKPGLRARLAVEVLIECAKQARCGCHRGVKNPPDCFHEPGCWFPALQESIAKAEQEAL